MLTNDSSNECSIDFVKTEEVAIKECLRVEKTRERLYSLGLIGAYDSGISFGNVSIRYKKKNSYVTTATQTGEFPKLNAKYFSLIKKIDIDKLNITAIGSSKPNLESIIDGVLYRLDENINAVIHIKNEKIVNFLLDTSCLNMGYCSCKANEIIEDILKVYKSIDPMLNNVFIIKGEFDGAVVFGKSLKHAEKTLYRIINELLK
jgi:hypothetical protein